MPFPSQKNLLMSGAVADLGLGLGDVTGQQMKDEDEERRKRLMRASLGYGDAVFGNAATSLLGKGY